MNSNSDYKVSVGRIARTLLYEDAQGTIRLGFDVDTSDGKKLVILERPGKSLIEAQQLRIDLAFERAKQYLISRGYTVEVFEG
ncbi:MAG: hypothetical protein JWR19_1174 [Pedosphaera sp.]|nr:hypothetical protein [Pedosphaera sp.]